MTREEALRVMAVLAAGKPAGGPDADAARLVWLPKLGKLDHQVAMGVAELLIDQPGHFFPVWGDFLAAYGHAAHRRRMETPALPEDTSGPATAETAKRYLGEIRAKIATLDGPLVRSLAPTVERMRYAVEHEPTPDVDQPTAGEVSNEVSNDTDPSLDRETDPSIATTTAEIAQESRGER